MRWPSVFVGFGASPTTQQPILCDNRDLLDTYNLPNKHFDAPSSLDQIVAAGESRQVFH